MRFCDEQEWGFGWILEGERLLRTSHALAVDAGVWVVDPVAWPDAEERARSLGRPLGVVQLLDRHARDCEDVAGRLGVPLHVVPFDGITGSPFDFLRAVRAPRWKEVALWWPEQRVLVCADAVGTGPFFRAAGERLGVHPLLRLWPPRRLGRVFPRHVLCGHGEGIHGEDVSDELHRALRSARCRLPGWLAAQISR